MPIDVTMFWVLSIHEKNFHNDRGSMCVKDTRVSNSER